MHIYILGKGKGEVAFLLLYNDKKILLTLVYAAWMTSVELMFCVAAMLILIQDVALFEAVRQTQLVSLMTSSDFINIQQYTVFHISTVKTEN